MTHVEAQAADTLLLAGTTQEWIARRSDRVVFVDQTTVRRVITLDLHLPADLLEPASAVLPVGRFRTGVALGNFTITDENGRLRSMLNRRDNIALVSRVVALACRLPPDHEDVEKLANGAAVEREDAALRLLGPLKDDAFATALVIDLVDNYLMLVPLECHVDRRRTLTISYEEPLIGAFSESAAKSDAIKGEARFQRAALQQRVPTDPDLSAAGWAARRSQLAEWLRWTDHRVTWRQNSVGDASSFHVEVEVPPDLEVTRARLAVSRPDETAFQFPSGDLGPRAHLYARVKQAGVEEWRPGTSATAMVSMRPREAGVLVAGSVLAGGAALLLVGGSFALTQALSARDGAAPLLLAGPTLLSAYLAQPGAHPLTAQMLRGPRLLIGTAGLVVFAATAALFVPKLATGSDSAVETVPTWLEWFWRASGGLCLLVALVLLTALWLMTRRPEPESADAINPAGSDDLGVPASLLATTEGQRHVPEATVEEVASQARALAGTRPPS